MKSKHIKKFNESEESPVDNMTFTLDDMERCWMAARRKSFDSGMPLYNSFEQFIQQYTQGD